MPDKPTDHDDERDRAFRQYARAATGTYELLLREGRRDGERGVQNAIMTLDENKLRWTLFDRVVRDLIAERAQHN